MTKTTEECKKLSIEQTLKECGTDDEGGLSGDDAGRRAKEYGFNEIPAREQSLTHRMVRRFWGPIPWMIEVAAVLSAVVRRWEDFVIITILLFTSVTSSGSGTAFWKPTN